jgi:integrase
VLDAFLFACETGLRYSDIVQLTINHIHTLEMKEGPAIKYLAFTAMKTKKANDMPLSDQAQMILERRGVKEGKIFPISHSQSASRILKTLFAGAKLNRACELVKLKGPKTEREMVPLSEVISFHMGRNTYITRLLKNNVSASYVKDNAGHSSINITMGYYRDDDIRRWQETLRALNEPIEKGL